MRQILTLNESQLCNFIKRVVNVILESFEVKGNYPLQTSLPVDRMTHHASADRRARFERMGDFGNPVYSFKVNTGHEKGDEIHTITDNAFVVVQNLSSGRIVTAFPGTVNQIYRYWNLRGVEPPHDRLFQDIVNKARSNQRLHIR